MTHQNCFIPDRTIQSLRLRLHLLESELVYWREKSMWLQGELENIPKSLQVHGVWHITIGDETTHVILDPSHHPKEQTP